MQPGERMQSLLRQSEAVPSNEDMDFLRQVVEKYPYYYDARLLWVKALFFHSSLDFESELKVLALHCYDRSVLSQLVRNWALIKSKVAKSESWVADNLIADNHSTWPLSFKLTDSIEPATEADALVIGQPSLPLANYPPSFDILKEFENNPATVDPAERRDDMDLIEKFLNRGLSESRHRNPNSEPTPAIVPVHNDTEDLVSETLAKIFLKQNKFQEAIDMYEKLRLRDPEKNTYFARQISEIKKKIE